MPSSPPVLSELGEALCFLFILLIPLAVTGLALLNCGLGKAHSAAHSMLAALGATGVASIVYVAIGYAWQGYIGDASHVFHAAGKPVNWLGAAPFFLQGFDWSGARSLVLVAQVLSVGVAAMIPAGAGADRWRLSATLLSAAVMAAWVYPLFAHWIWAGGWLAQLGTNYGLGRGFMDAGGASSIHAVGGLTALAVAWILGPRRGKYSHEGMPTAIPGHNTVLVLLGCFLALAGWFGLNCAGAMLFNGVPAERAGLIVVNTLLSAASAGLAVGVITQIRFGKPDASLCANGWVGGLVSVSAVSPFVVPAAAILIGLLGGCVVALAVEWLEVRFGVDDPAGAISVHAVGGLWSIFAVGLFARVPPASGPESGQWVAQLVGIATLVGYVLPMAYGLHWLLNRIHPMRVVLEGERQGLDLHDLGAGAYPEFVTHTDEFGSLYHR